MYKNVLLAVDLNHEESWLKALPVAVQNCKAFGAKLHVVTVVPDFGMPIVASHFPDDFHDKVIADVEKHLKKFMADHVPKDVQSAHSVASGGPVYDKVMDYANANKIDLIIMGAYRPDLKNYLLGPNAARVARHARQSVLVVRE